MVSLAKKFKDQPFHLIASNCQGFRFGKDVILGRLKKHGWSEGMENFTVAHQTMYKRGVQKGMHVPYYFIFDHTGKLRYHHQAGPWHGGDGDKYQELVAQLIKEIPKQDKPQTNKPLTKLRDWTNTEGKTLKAVLLKVKDGKAHFRKKNGSVFWYDLDQLIREDREEIKKLAE